MKRRDFLINAGLLASATSMIGGFDILKAAEMSAPRNTIEGPYDSLDAGLQQPLTAVVIGAGSRGTIYASYAEAFPGSFKIVGVSDINDFRKERTGKQYSIDRKHRFGDWSEVFAVPKFADIAIITTPDNLHYEPCMKALEMGYHVLLEKPVAQTEQQCRDILAQSRKYGRIVAICHVLRYAPFYIEMRKMVQSGAIGDMLSIQHLEPVGHIHMSHSFVRGHWRNSKQTNPMIISKSCHDLDILRWIVDKPCKSVSAFGRQSYFMASNAPAGSAARCLDCSVERECIFSAKKIYYDRRSWLTFDLSGNKETEGEEIMEQLRTGPYGRCVFHCDNDQCDHYAMNMEFEDGITVAFSLEAMTSYDGRLTRIMGTKGDIVGDMKTFTHTDFLTGKQTVWESPATDGHGGGDHRLVRDFLLAVCNEDESMLTSTVEASLESHIMGFRAEKSRMDKTVEML